MSLSENEVLEDLNFSSDRISVQVRTIGMSLIGMIWVVINGQADAGETADVINRTHLFMIGGLVILGMFCDFLQYVVGYWYTYSVFKIMEQSPDKAHGYNPKAFRYRVRTGLFWAKQLMVGGAVAWFVGKLIKNYL